MKDFIAEIKRINTDGVIFEFSKASIDMFQRQQYQKPFDVLSTRFDVQKKVGVPLSAWDIQDIAYLAVLHSNDYRRGKNLPQMGYLINLYRGYENANSIADELRKSNIDRIFRAILGMSAEQFQYENINWIFEKFNRDYYILLAADDFEHRPLLDAEAAVKETLGLSADEYIMVLLMVFGLSKLDPIPLGWYDRPEASTVSQKWPLLYLTNPMFALFALSSYSTFYCTYTLLYLVSPRLEVRIWQRRKAGACTQATIIDMMAS